MMNIETLLKERDISKAELARQIGVQRQNIAGMLKNPTLSSMKRIASALGVEVWQLLVSPSEACSSAEADDFVAMIRFRGEYYHAGSVDELEKLISDWKAEDKK